MGRGLDVDTACPTVAGRYRLLERLGSGGMGTVWRAEDLVLTREVAVKELTLPAHLTDADRDVLRARMRREARAAARLDHPSAMTVFDVVEEHGRPWLVMELITADTLADLVRTQGPLSPTRTAQVGLALLGALRAAHARGILHRDVKPSNVLVVAGEHDDGRIVLTDFGIATTTGDPTVTATGVLVGSPSYMAPERGRGEAPGPASDLWSLGATLYTVVEGVPPYDAGDPLTTLLAAMNGEPRPYELAGPLVPVLDGLLDKDPARRLDAAAAQRLLTEVAAGSAVGPSTSAAVYPDAPGSAPRTSTRPSRGAPTVHESGAETSEPSRSSVSRRPVQVAAAIAVVAALAGGTALALRPDGRPAGPVISAQPTGSPGPTRSAQPTQAPASAPPSAPPSASAVTSAPSTAAVPAGLVAYQDPAGWSVATPDGWRQSTSGTQRLLRDPTSKRSVVVDTESLGSNVLAAVRDTAAGFGRRHTGYHEIRLVPTRWFGQPATDWEFTWTEAGSRLHADIHNVVIHDHSYAVVFQTSDGDWAASAAVRDKVFASFRPA